MAISSHYARVRVMLALGLFLLIVFASPPSKAEVAEEIAQIEVFLSVMQKFYELIEQVHENSDDAEKSAILQLFKIKEIYEERGEKTKAIDVYRMVLEKTDNSTIRNATTVMLGEILKETGRPDEAVEVLRSGLMENLQNAE